MSRVAAALAGVELSEPPPPTDPRTRQRPPRRDMERLSESEGCDTVFVNLLRGDDVKVRALEWVWRHYLVGGKLHLLGGPAGVGKTTVCIDFLATTTVGGLWPDGTRAALGSVLVWSGEDDIADTLAPKLIALGADMSRVHFVTDLTYQGRSIPFDPSKHMDALQDMALRIADLRLILVDPVVAAVAGDSHKNGEVRRGLAPLQALAERTGAAVIGVTHFTKGTQSKDPVERITGSLAFAAAARVVIVAAKRKDEGDQVFMRAKSNVGPLGGGFTYVTEQVDVAGHPGVTASIVRWTGPVEGEARDVLHAAEAFDEEGGSKMDDAKSFLRDLLSDGPMETGRVRRECEGACHSWSTVKRAQESLRIVPRKELGRNGKWKWALPVTQP